MFMTDRDFWVFIATLIGMGAALGVALAWGVPWLWGMVKPWLHVVTG